MSTLHGRWISAVLANGVGKGGLDTCNGYTATPLMTCVVGVSGTETDHFFLAGLPPSFSSWVYFQPSFVARVETPDDREKGVSMLVLSRKINEKIVISDDIVITVVSVRGDCVRLGVVAPSNVTVDRQEVHERRHQKPDAAPEPN